mgnify:CR=1 FL=1
MILTRYLIRDIFSHTASVSLVFLFIIISSRSIQYLEQAARGEINPEMVFWIMMFRAPGFIELLIPFSLFLSIILVMGRLYSHNEMIVMEQIGLSFPRILSLLLSIGIFFAIITSIFSLWLTPILSQEVDELLSQKTLEDNFKSIQPGKFHRFENKAIIYAKEKNGQSLQDVFIKPLDVNKEENNFISTKSLNLQDNGSNSLVLHQGFIFEKTGENLTKTFFNKLIFNLGESKSDTDISLNKEANSMSKFQWGISIPLLCIISVLLATPISRLEPRQGRYLKVLPAIIIFASYMGLLILFRGWMEQSYINVYPGLFTIHFLFFILSLFLILRLRGVKLN